MADGNLGSLWMSLGIKETVSDGLKKVLSSLDKTDEKSAAVGKEINSFIKELNSAKVSDSLLKSIGRIGELLSASTSGAESLGRVLKGLNVKEMSALGGNVNMSNLKEAHSLITKIMQAMSSRNMSNTTMDKFFDLGNAQAFLTQIMTIDKNLKSLKDSSKGITDTVLKGDADMLVNKLTSLRKQFLESFNSGTWRGNNTVQEQLNNATNSLIQFYDKLNASKGNQSLFDSVSKEATKANEALKTTEEQAKKTADAVASIGTKRKPAVENQELAKEIERLTKNPASVKEGSNDIAGVKKQADDAKESVIKLRYELNEVLNAFRGSASKNLGVEEAGEKGRQYVDILNQVNKKIEEISKKEGGDKATAEIKSMLSSAQSYIDLLERIRKKYIEISDIRTTNPNVDTAKIKEALGLISHFREQLTQLESGRFLTGVDKSNVLPNYGRAWASTVRTVDEITKGLSNTNTLSDLKNKADKANSTISMLETSISKVERAIDRGKQKGFNTDNLFDNLAALKNRKAEFDRALTGDPKRLNNKAYMEGLYSETARDMSIAKSAMERFGMVMGKVSEQEKAVNDTRKAQHRVNQEVLDDYNRMGKEAQENQLRQQKIADLQEKANKKATDSVNKEIADEKNRLVKEAQENQLRQQKIADLQEKAWKNITKSGFRGGSFVTPGSKEASQGYLDIANAYKKAVDTLQTKHGEAKINLTRLLDEYNKEVKELESKIKAISPKMDGLAWNGKKLSPKDLAAYEELVKQLEHLKNTKGADSILAQTNFDIEERKLQRLIGLIKDYEQLSERVAKGTYKPYDANSYEQKRISETAALKNAILERYKTEQDAAKQLKREEAEAKRQSIANEKQRQTELENSLRRIQSMEKALANLQEKRFTSKMFGFDVSEADAKIFAMKIRLNELYDIARKLESWDMTAVGKLGNLGNGRETRAANDLARSYDKANKEAQRGVDIEQKRQQEIAKSAAKARNDLASAFAGANAEARKMQSIVGDIKSLFLQGGIVFGAQQFFNSIVQTGGEIVQQHVALRSILGDVQKADELFAQTQQLALQSPFKFGELNRDVKQLAAFGVEANDLYDTTKRLADIASGLGVSFERLGLAYGQVKARSWLDGKELRQFAYAGLPLLQRITEMYNREGKNGKNNYTEADVKKMISARGVSFNDVQKVLWEMTDEGGQFYNMQLVLSETLLGRWNKLIDAWDIMLGKFADGKGVIGGTFSFAINRVTDLILALDKLSPAVMSFGAIFAARKLAGFASSKLSVGSLKTDYTSQINAQLRSYAIEQQKLVTEGAIKQEIAAQNVQKRAYMLADADSLKASFSRLALEGKMSVLQMQRALKEGLIDEALVKELATMGMITARQEQIILNGGRTAAVFNMAGSKLSGLFNMLGGWWGIGIAAISSLVMAVSQYSNKIEQETKAMTDSARQNAKRIDDFLASIGSKPTDREGLKKDIDGMKDLLEQSNLYTDTIKEQVERSGDLAKQYDILKEKVIEARKATKFDEQFADTAVNAVARSRQSMLVGETLNESGLGKGWLADTLGVLSGLFNDDLETNANELAESLNRVSLSLSTAFDENQRKKIDAVADSMLPAADRTKSLEEKIATLRDKGGNDWDNFVSRVASGDKDIEKHLENVGDASKGMMSDLNEIAEDDVPKMIVYLQQSLHLYGKDFEDWCKRNPHKYAQMWDDMLAVAKVKAPAIADIIKRLAMSAVGIVSTDDRKGGGKKTYNSGIDTDFASVIRDRLFKNGTLTGKKKKGKFWVREVDSYLRQVQDDSWQKTGENVQTKLKAARNELDMLDTGKADKNSKHYKSALHEYSIWKAISDAGYISDDLGKNKTTGNFGKDGKNGRQEDSELKALQERLSSLKSARQMYQKYSSIMSDKDAADKTYKLFPEVKDLDLKNYQAAARKLLDGFKINTNDRKKFQTSVYREVAEWLFSEKDKKEFDKKAAELTEEMNRLSDRWDLYKSLLEKTGNTWFARSAWVDAFQTDEKSKSLMDLYYQKYKKIFNMQEALSLTDGDAKEKLKGAGEYELWKKIVDLLRGNYVQSLQDGADAMQKMASYADKIRVINKKYDEKVKNQNDPVVVARMNRMRNQELGAASEEEFKGSSDYINFYGAIMSLGMDKAQKIGENIRKYLNDALSSGRIDAREYAKELKLLNEQLSKLTSPRKTFFNGGLKGLAEQKIQDANEQYTLASSKIAEGMKVKNLGEELGDDNLIARGNSMIESGKAMAKAASILFKDGTKAKESLDKFAGVVSVIDQNVQGMVEAFNDVKETAALLGADTESDAWQDASAFFETFSGMSNSISKVVSSAENGNIGGILAGTVGVFTSPIKSFAKAHDAKLDRQINLAERQLTELKNLSANISAVIEKTLGGIYAYQRSDATASKLSEIKNDYQAYNKLSKSNFWGTIIGGKNLSRYSDDTYNAVLDTDKNYSAYADQLALLKAQRDELQKQRNSEADKKKKDKDKLADYDQQLEEMGLQIKTFAQDFLKDIYSIDMKSWASELADAVVGAWEKGEDAVDAYKDKVKSLVKDVTKSIVTQKFMEKALKKPLEFLTSELDKNGKLDESSMTTLVDMLYNAGEEAIPQITKLYDMLKERGLDLRENGSSSTTNSIKGVTEETADLLASYINDIRLNVSVDRENIKLIADAVTGLPELNVIAQSQLTAMNQLVTLAEYRNSKLDDMYSWMRAVTSGTGTKSIRMN